MSCQVTFVLIFLAYIFEKYLVKLPQTEHKRAFFEKPIKLIPEKSLEIKNNLIIKLDKLWAINDITEFFIDNIFVIILLLPEIFIQMESKSLNLIPNSIELFKIILQNFILWGFYCKFISRDKNFIDLIILFLSG